MATSDKKNLLGYDPLAWLGEETENLVLDDLAGMTDEAVQEAIVVSEGDTHADGSVSLSESTSDDEFLEEGSSEIDMNTIADLLENQVSDETAAEEDVVEALVKLDATLTIQNVVKLHEKLKKSYSTNNSLEIDASQVSSIDTATLQLLVALKKDAVKQQKSVVFAAPSRRFIESAELLGVLEILEIDI